MLFRAKNNPELEKWRGWEGPGRCQNSINSMVSEAKTNPELEKWRGWEGPGRCQNSINSVVSGGENQFRNREVEEFGRTRTVPELEK